MIALLWRKKDQALKTFLENHVANDIFSSTFKVVDSPNYFRSIHNHSIDLLASMILEIILTNIKRRQEFAENFKNWRTTFLHRFLYDNYIQKCFMASTSTIAFPMTLHFLFLGVWSDCKAESSVTFLWTRICVVFRPFKLVSWKG